MLWIQDTFNGIVFLTVIKNFKVGGLLNYSSIIFLESVSMQNMVLVSQAHGFKNEVVEFGDEVES